MQFHDGSEELPPLTIRLVKRNLDRLSYIALSSELLKDLGDGLMLSEMSTVLAKACICSSMSTVLISTFSCDISFKLISN